ncbi:cation:proton antiporter domain-containing protein [Roseovarius sp. 217]|uniref:cation:proton antiporter domain-containing protein n=2 Tax=unclassified Roseovarius TaxID=2614913 RepID=UPI0000685BF3|nr:Na+/H+ antiporter, CPA1 family protein [Roseovarius sp. 217]
MPLLFVDLRWVDVGMAALLILVIRPLAGWVALWGSDLDRRSRAVVSVYGVRGIGSIYYLCYAAGHVDFANEAQLWSLIALVILISTILHGFSVGRAMDGLEDA